MKNLFFVFFTVAALTGFVSCDNDNSDRLDDARDRIEEAVDDTGDAISDGVEDAGDEIEDATDN